jgi:hypothetical protein
MTNLRENIDEMLRQSRNIAVPGASDKLARASYNITRYLINSGYKVFPVNPALKVLLGRHCHASLEAADAAARAETGQGIDLVDVFRSSEHVPSIVDDAIRLGISYLWLQDGVEHEEAIAKACAAGLKCVQNDCIYRQHAARPELHG